MSEAKVLTVGHSTHPIDEFIELLTSAGVTDVVDVRTLPGSRRFPHFNEENLGPSLEDAGIAYSREEALGGLRKADPTIDPSLNGFWENKSFKRYADYAQHDEFRSGLDRLIGMLGPDRTPAIMCSEAVWWRCHRRIIADFLLARDIPVFHLMPNGSTPEATLTSGARVEGHNVTYPAP
ncbi:DUF488 family protein [Flaviflexus huanghaiensis]|uniref:DUF488 domain-containing protein n=1 Tax=Flaviflexus huanghaiensis TaxID=1111473 RepID=UPI0015FC3212|nr:DUF488 domain-containing protein [Flaviflexus huanghaiensis]